MRARGIVFILACLLIAAGAWFFRPQGHHPAGNALVKPSVSGTAGQSAAAAPNAPSFTILSTNPVSIAATSAGTNQFAWRLSNTTKTIGELVNDRHAILLANALIDTSAKLNFSIPKKMQAQGDPGAYIVQAGGPINSAFRAMLAGSGAQIVSYIPNDAYLVTVSAGGANALAGSPMTQAVIPYEPYYKVSASLLPWIGKSLPPDATLNVELFPGADKTAIPAIEAAGGNVLSQSESQNGLIVNVQPPPDWTVLPALPGAHFVEPSHRRVTANDLSRATVGVAADTQTTSNYLNLTGSNVIVEVNDSGIDATHPDFSAGGMGPVRVIGDAPQSLVDTNGHGTHVAGIIAGDGTESMTVSNAQGSIMPGTTNQFRGMAPAATLFSVGGVEGGSDTNFISDQYLQEAPALTNALISNNSWNYGGDSAYDLEAASYDAAVRDALPLVTGSQPVLFVFSAGNEGNGDDTTDPGSGTPDSIDSPATAKNVITVGAIQEFRDITNAVTNADGTIGEPWNAETSTSYRLAGFSSRGNVGIGTEGTFGRYKPDVVAPGTFVVSTRSSQWDIGTYFYQSTTNYNLQDFSVVVKADSLGAGEFPPVPTNTVQATIQLFPNGDSPVSFPNLPIYFGLVSSPIYTAVTTNNQVSIPPDGGLTIADILSSGEGFYGFNFAISNITSEPINLDIVLDTITTNNPGNYFLVYSNLDNSLDGNVPPHYYRYETGTSMSAADVSGVLALMQDYFTNTLQTTPSPALLKAMLINGARPTGLYDLNVQNNINYEGWGLINLPDSLPQGVTNLIGAGCSSFFIDQSPTNALATGDSHTFMVNITSPVAQTLPLRVTLTWTDPPGDPAAAIKLVNSLALVVTNLDDPANPVIYYGNDIGSGSIYNTPEGTNTPPIFDSINNVQNVYISQPLGTNYSITVIGLDVNVNAVTAQTNNAAGVYAPNVVQDFAMVVSCGEGEVTNAMTVTDNGVVSNPTSDQQITFANTNQINAPLLNQFVGASTPLLGTNTVAPGAGFGFAANAVLTLGMTNQWHFYVVTNTTGFSNAAFITFLPDTLSIPRMGVLADSTANATTPEADIDIFATTDSSVTNLNPVAISNCVNGAQVGETVGAVFNSASLGRGGTEFIVDTNSAPGEVYYIGVQSERQVASEFDFLSVFSAAPFSQMQNGNQVVNGLLLPYNIPDGSPAHPGIAYIFGLAIYPMGVDQVVVNDSIWHQNFGDLIGTLKHNGIRDVLNNHDSLGNPPGPYNFIYDDSGSGNILGSQQSDGPGSLQDFTGTAGIGPWILTEEDTALTQTGYVSNYSLTITPHQDLGHGINVVVQPGKWFYDYIDVPVGYTNLTIFATNLPPTVSPPVELFVKLGSLPTFTDYDESNLLVNGTPPGNSISVGPPLTPGRYFVGIFNPSFTAANVYLIASLSFSASAITTMDYDSTGPVPILDDAVTTNSIFVSDTDIIQDFTIGLRVDHPRISDLVFHLISPDGTRYLMMENRGGTSTNGCGATAVSANVIPISHNGGAEAVTNTFDTGTNSGSITINYNMYTLPDRMVVYDGSTLLWDSGYVSFTGTKTLAYSGSPIITIIMNPGGNTNYPTTAWTYTVDASVATYYYLSFTEDTNLTTTPIKFAPPPFVPDTTTTNFFADGFEQAMAGDYTNGQTFGKGWTVISNQVTVVTDPTNAYEGSNFLALASGAVSNTLPTVAGQTYTLSFAYRGPGIVGWWRGENNANDSIYGNNGIPSNITYASGEVGQAFQFNGTASSYVKVPANAALDVGLYNGFTVETWADPTTTNFASNPMTLVEWNNGSGALSGIGCHLEFYNGGVIVGDVVDPSGTDHSVQTPSGNVTANIPQHVVMTYNKTSGLLSLYRNGLMVANQNVGNWSPTPGFDLYFGIRPAGIFAPIPYQGLMDEISLYNRVLSDSEIQAIYQDGSLGKFDPAVFTTSPAQSLSEAAINLTGGSSGTINGNNTNWQVYTTTFTATQNGTPLQIAGIEPGMLLDDFTLSSTPSSLYYLPEQDMSAINGQNSYGLWTLEIQDDRAGASNNATLVSWQLGFTYANTNVLAGSIPILNPGVPITGTVDGPNWYQVNVPENAIAATNLLLTASAPVNILYSLNYPPTTNYPGDAVLIANATNGVSVLNPATTPALVPGGTYYLGVEDTVGPPTTYTIEVNYDYSEATVLTPDQPQTNTVMAGGIDYYSVTVPANADFATNLLLFATGPLNVWFNQSTLPVGANPPDYELLSGSTGGSAILDSSTTPPLVPGQTYFLAVQNTGATSVNFGIAVDFHLLPPAIASNSITWSLINVPTNADFATNLLVSATGPLNVWYSTNNPPTITNPNDFDMIPGSTNGSYVLGTTGSPDIVPGGSYWLGVQNTNGFAVSYDVQVNFHLLPTIASNSITWSLINVPTNADFATNLLVFATAPVNVWWSTNNPPTITNANDLDMIPGSTNGSYLLGTTGTPDIVPGGSYWLGVQNTNSFAVTYDVQVNFHLLPVVASNSITWSLINVPTNADFATNLLVFATAPVNVWWSTNNPPTITNANDLDMIPGSTNGSYLLGTNTTPAFITPGGSYWLGVQNTNSFAVTCDVQVNFHLLNSTNPPLFISSIIATNIGGKFGFLLTWFAPSNDLFQVQWAAGLSPASWNTFTNIVSYNTNFFTSPAHTQFNFFDDGSQTGGFGPARFYRLVLLQSLTNGVPQTNTVPAGNFDYFLINVPTNADFATNQLLSATGPLNVWFNQTVPPTGTGAGDYALLTDAASGISILSTTSAPTNIVPGGSYWLGVQNTNSFAVTFSLEVNFHLLPATNTSISISSITFTNLGGTNGFLLRWFAATNDVFQVQWEDALSPADWQFFMNFIYYTGPATPTNGLFTFFDDGSQTPPGLPTLRFYRIVLVGSYPSTHTNAVSISSITSTNVAGTNGFRLNWSAPTNYLIEVQWTTNLVPVVAWQTFPDIIAYSTFVSPTNSLFDLFDNGSQGGLGPIKFYRLIVLP